MANGAEKQERVPSEVVVSEIAAVLANSAARRYRERQDFTIWDVCQKAGAGIGNPTLSRSDLCCEQLAAFLDFLASPEGNLRDTRAEG